MNKKSTMGDRLRSLLVSIVDRFSICSHRKTTLPMTGWLDATADRHRGASGEMYVVCLDCGRRLPYDWKKMRLGKPQATRDNPPSGRTGTE